MYVMVWQDMPHLVKRCVNALEYSNPNNNHSRNLTKFCGASPCPLCLDMIYDAWAFLGGRDLSQISIARKLTIGHFEKDCFSRMRVSLAFQVVSNSAKQLCEKATEEGSGLPSKDK